MPGTPVHFPRGKYYALTWGIPDDYGGMTSTLLHRSRAFHRLGGLDVEVLTLDDRPDYAELAARLRESGELVEGLRLRNLWDDLREREITAAREPGPPIEPAEPLAPRAGDRIISHEGVVLLRERRDDAGGFAALDRFRRDGTLLETEREAPDGRRIVLYDAAGRAMRQWTSRRKLYRWWLDQVFRKRLSFLLVDSKTSARIVPGYRRDHVVTVHIVHASHREDPDQPSIRPSREAVLRRSGDFDAVVVLTERQRAELLSDLEKLGVESAGRIRVIPNGIDLPPVELGDRSRGSGILVASLDKRKRVDRAIETIIRAHGRDARIRLDLYGDGPLADAVEAQVEQARASSFVTLHGYQPSARSHFGEADFSLLTSESEGLPLVLVESMAAGCIPIAYDIRYGPADMIRDGIDGYLLPAGDVDGMADRILALQQLSPARLKAMRRRAVARSREFSDEAIARRWARELERALDGKRIAAASDAPPLTRLRRRAGVLRRHVQRLVGR